jgi:hypothetical protein
MGTVESLVALLDIFPGCADFTVGIKMPDGRIVDFDIVFDPKDKTVLLCVE